MFTQAVEIAKAQFEAFLEEVGTTCTWKPRAAVTPASQTDELVQYAADYDPQGSTYSPGDWNNTTLFPSASAKTIRILKDQPSRLQAESAGQMVTGTAIAQTAVENAVAVGDYLIIGSEVWRVMGARLVSPPIYRELTLERKA